MVCSEGRNCQSGNGETRSDTTGRSRYRSCQVSDFASSLLFFGTLFTPVVPHASVMSTTTCPSCGSDYDASLTACPTCGGLPSIPDPALPNGTRLDGGKFTVVRILGQGGFSITYEGFDETLQRTVAIKELFLEGAVRHGTQVVVPTSRRSAWIGERTRVLDEARRIAAIKSPNIVDIYAMFEENGTAYIIMEFLRGHTLQEKIQQSSRLSEDEVLTVALALCEALDTVHGLNMLHRDIKPANVL